MSVSGWTGYTVHLCIYYAIRYVVHMARHITDCNNPPNTTYNTNVATGHIIRNRNNLTGIALYVHITVPNSCSYNYIFKVLFTTPSWYLFSIVFGHVSIFRWALAPIHIPVQKNINRIMHAVNKCVQVPYGAVTLNGSVLQKDYTNTLIGSTAVYNNSMHMQAIETAI